MIWHRSPDGVFSGVTSLVTASVDKLADLTSRVGHVSVVSTFAPAHDGIARYADQLVAALISNGAQVKRLGLAHCNKSGGDEILDVKSGSRFLRVVRCTPRRVTVLVMWHGGYFTGGRQLDRIVSVGSIAAGFRLRRTIVVPHEPDDDLVTDVRGLRAVSRRAEERLRALMWCGADEVWFHSSYERDMFTRRYPAAAAKASLRLIDHGQAFEPEVSISRGAARRLLRAPPDEQMFLCPGFFSAHKGVDRVVRAFRRAAPINARLWIVGSAIREDDETRQLIQELRHVVSKALNVEFRERYVSDEEFDLWLRAADVVVAAYRTAASSSVIPRAQLLGARVIGSGAGGTAEQLRPGIDIIAADEKALTAAFANAATAT